MILLILFLVIAYLLGSLPSADLVCKWMGLADPRTQGSGNPGATNVLRFAGKKPAIYVLTADLLKGMLAVLLVKLFGLPHIAVGLVAIAAVLGHIFPVFANFKGGKGVATAAGAILGLSFPLGIALIITWLTVAAITRYSSLAAITAPALAPIYSLWLAESSYQFPILIITGILIWCHYDNINKLMAGTETKINLNHP